MKCNSISPEPPAAAAAPDQPEPLEEAMREVSARIARCGDENRSLCSRLGELFRQEPGCRRRRTRQAPPTPPRPVTFFSIEEAGAGEASAPPQLA